MSRKLAFRIPQTMGDLFAWASLLNTNIGPLAEQPQTFVDADTTPSIRGAEYFECANTGATAITTFDDGITGQTITIKVDANTTLTNGATLMLAGAVDFVGSGDDLITLRFGSDSVWREQSRSVN